MATKVVYGADMTPYGVFIIAKTYRLNADALVNIGTGLSDHPRRLLYFQALENYLRSFQLLRGATPKEVRAHNHDFAERLKVCKAMGLKLPNDVENYIRSPARKKEYVRIRYDFRLDDQDTLDETERTMERLRAVVAEVEGTIGRALEASNPDFIVLDGKKLTMIVDSATFKAWS